MFEKVLNQVTILWKKYRYTYGKMHKPNDKIWRYQLYGGPKLPRKFLFVFNIMSDFLVNNFISNSISSIVNFINIST